MKFCRNFTSRSTRSFLPFCACVVNHAMATPAVGESLRVTDGFRRPWISSVSVFVEQWVAYLNAVVGIMIDLCQWRAAIGGYNSRYRWNPRSNGRAKVSSPWIPFLYAMLTVLSQLTSLSTYLVENIIFSSLATSGTVRRNNSVLFLMSHTLCRGNG